MFPKPTRGQLAHVGKLIIAGIPAFAAALVDGYTQNQFNVSLIATALMVLAEFVAHGLSKP